MSPTFFGVSLPLFAGVGVACDMGLPLHDVLAQEGVTAAQWAEAERAFRDLLSSDAEQLRRYGELRHEAEDCLARRIDPAEDDPVAWTALRETWLAASDPAAWLAAQGLTAVDLNRLARRWTRRAADEPAVTQTLRRVAGTGAPLPALEIAPLVLRPFPFTAEASAAAQGAPPSQGASGARLPVDTDMDLFAALHQIVALTPDAAPRALALCGIDRSELSAVTERWWQTVADDPRRRAALDVRLADYGSTLRAISRGARPRRRGA